MFFHRKRTSFYQFVILALTAALGGLMFATLRGTVSDVSSPAVPPVTEADYRAGSRAVVAPFLEAYASAETDVARLVAVEDALAAMAGVTVPASYRDAHLGLAVSLALLRDGLRGDAAALADGNARLAALIGNYPWMAR
jgi:hypothetical protein